MYELPVSEHFHWNICHMCELCFQGWTKVSISFYVLVTLEVEFQSISKHVCDMDGPTAKINRDDL